MERQMNAISSACYYHIHDISHINQSLMMDACKILAHALIAPQLDNGSILPYSFSSILMDYLQRVQNFIACLMTCIHKCEYTAPVVNSLHWLPDIYRFAEQDPGPCLWSPTWDSLRVLRGTCCLSSNKIPRSEAMLTVCLMYDVTKRNRCFRKAAVTL